MTTGQDDSEDILADFEQRTVDHYLPPAERLSEFALRLQEQVDRAVTQAEQDKPDAKFVTVAVADLKGVQIVSTLKLPIGGAWKWSVSGYARKEYKGDFEAGVQTRLVL